MKTFEIHKVFGAISDKAKDFRKSHGDKPAYSDLLILVNRETYKALRVCANNPRLIYDVLPLGKADDHINIECDVWDELKLADGEVRITLR